MLLTRSQDVDHPQGKGKLIRVLCEVEFHILIPINLEDHPYYLFTSVGVHNHAPPPPSKVPEVLSQEIVDLIRRSQDPNITAGKSFSYSSELVLIVLASLLRGPFMEEFCRKHSKSSFGQVHATLNNLDRLRATIYREKLIMYPAGQDITGVQFEMERKNQDPDDVRTLSHRALNLFLTACRSIFAKSVNISLELSSLL